MAHDNGSGLDDLTRAMAGTSARRGAFRGLVAVGAWLAAVSGAGSSQARNRSAAPQWKRCRTSVNRSTGCPCEQDEQCASLACTGGVCAESSGPTLGSGGPASGAVVGMTQFSKTERFGGNRVVTSQVNCAAAPEGQTVIPIGGGWDGALSAASNGGLSVVTSRQVTGGWEVRYQTGTSMSATYNLTTYVYCLYVTA